MYDNYQLNLGKGKNYQIQIIKGANLSYLGSFGISSFSDGLRFAEYDVFKATIFFTKLYIYIYRCSYKFDTVLY